MELEMATETLKTKLVTGIHITPVSEGLGVFRFIPVCVKCYNLVSPRPHEGCFLLSLFVENTPNAFSRGFRLYFIAKR